jgi:hypothetical protein
MILLTMIYTYIRIDVDIYDYRSCQLCLHVVDPLFKIIGSNFVATKLKVITHIKTVQHTNIYYKTQ